MLNNPLRYTDPSGHFTEEEIQRHFGIESWEELRRLYGERLYELMNSGLTWGDVIVLSNGNSAEILIMFGFAESGEDIVMQLRQDSSGILHEGERIWTLSQLSDILQQQNNAAVYRTDLRFKNDSFERISGLGWGSPPTFSAPGGRAGYQMHFYYDLDASKILFDTALFVGGAIVTVAGLGTVQPFIAGVGVGLLIIGAGKMVWEFCVDKEAYDAVYPVFYGSNHPAAVIKRIRRSSPGNRR